MGKLAIANLKLFFSSVRRSYRESVEAPWPNHSTDISESLKACKASLDDGILRHRPKSSHTDSFSYREIPRTLGSYPHSLPPFGPTHTHNSKHGGNLYRDHSHSRPQEDYMTHWLSEVPIKGDDYKPHGRLRSYKSNASLASDTDSSASYYKPHRLRHHSSSGSLASSDASFKPSHDELEILPNHARYDGNGLPGDHHRRRSFHVHSSKRDVIMPRITRVSSIDSGNDALSRAGIIPKDKHPLAYGGTWINGKWWRPKTNSEISDGSEKRKPGHYGDSRDKIARP